METFSYLGWIANYNQDFKNIIDKKIKEMYNMNYDVFSINQNFIKNQGGQILTTIIFKK